MATAFCHSVLTPQRVLPKPTLKQIISVSHPWSFHLMLLRDCCSPAGGAGRGWRMLRALWQDDKLDIFFLFCMGGFSLRAALFAQCWQSAAVEVRWQTLQRGHACGNELLIPEGRAEEITLIWTLLLWLIFVMQSYSMATMHRWLWIMAPPLSARPQHTSDCLIYSAAAFSWSAAHRIKQ